MRTRPWRQYAIAFAVMIILTAAALQPIWGLTARETLAVRWIIALVWVGLALRAYRGLRRRVGTAAIAGEARITVQFGLVAGLIVVVLVVLWLLGVSPTGIAVGGAVTGAVLGLATTTALSNFFAGTVLMAVHPYVPGDIVTLRSWYFGGVEYRGRVVDLNFFYTLLDDGTGRRIALPNLAVAVASVTHHGDFRTRVPVPLPVNVNLAAAERALTQSLAGASLSLNRFDPAAVWVDVALPEGAQPSALAPWFQTVTRDTDATAPEA